MARVKLSGGISSIEGSIGGTVYRNINGQTVISSKNYNRQSGTEIQYKQRNQTNNIQNAWLGLTDAERNWWSVFAGFYKQAQSNNVSKYISGHQLFLLINQYRVILGLGVLITPAALKGRIQPIQFTFTTDNTTLTLTSDRSIDSSFESVILFMSWWAPATINNSSGRLRVFRNFTYSGTTKDITTDYLIAFSTIPQSNDYCFVEYAVMDKETGEFSGWKKEKIHFSPFDGIGVMIIEKTFIVS